MIRTSCLIVLLTFCGCAPATVAPPAQRSTETATVPAVSTPANDGVKLQIVSFDGIREQIEKHKGQVVVMDAWSTSCPPCMKEFHNLVELHKKYGTDDLACISLSFDYEGLGTPEEQMGRVLEFLKSQGATFDNLLSSEESDMLYRKLQLAAVPAVFVYDRTGTLRKRFDNEKAKSAAEAFTYAQVGELVAELVKEPAPAKP